MKSFLRQLALSIFLCITSISFLQGQTGGEKIPYFTIISPLSISTFYPFEDGAFTVPADWGASVANDIIIAPLKRPDVAGDSLYCDSLSNIDFTGKIAFIPRGSCEFGFKALRAQQHGALAVVIMNNDLLGGTAVGMGVGSAGAQVTIPVMMIGYYEGLSILQTLMAGEEVIASLGAAPLGFTLLEGDIKRDENNNCTADANETGIGKFKIGVQSGNGVTNIRTTDSTGHYKVYVNPAAAPFEVFALPPSSGWIGCPGSVTITSNTPDTIATNLVIQNTSECVQLETEITSPILRRCFPADFKVDVCNQGTVTATAAYVDVTLAPEFGLIQNATLPFSTSAPGTYRFQLGDLDPFECIYIQFNAEISCDSTIIGQTLCYSAHAYPDTSCLQPNASWNGADVTVQGSCQGNTVEFVITNQGATAMSAASEYIVIQDDVMYMTVPFQLGAGESQTVSLPADGSTWRLEAGQVPGHPRSGNPAKAVEGCSTSGNFTTGYLLMFPIYDEGNAVDEECKEVVGSYDPNDKQGFPLGFTEARLIRPETDIDYLIRFQNTGTDTAFTVVVRDTLTAALDPMSIRSVICSHPYTLEIKNDSVAVFRFNQILLVDSVTNEPASHGYLSFKIAQKHGNPFGTIIENRAGIYFDFNPPVMTNTTHHEVGEVVTVVPAKELPGQSPPLVYPNPVPPNTVLQLKGDVFNNATYMAIDLQGKTRQSGTIANNRIALSGIQSGIYILEILTGSGERYAVKIMVK